MPESNVPDTGVQCPKCGVPPSPPAATVVEDEPITHCEWCGAEYPEPEHDGAATGDSPAP